MSHVAMFAQWQYKGLHKSLPINQSISGHIKNDFESWVCRMWQCLQNDDIMDWWIPYQLIRAYQGILKPFRAPSMSHMTLFARRQYRRLENALPINHNLLGLIKRILCPSYVACGNVCTGKIERTMELHIYDAVQWLRLYAMIQCKLIAIVRVPSYCSLSKSKSWLLMPWILASSINQQPRYWLRSKLGRSLSYMSEDFN